MLYFLQEATKTHYRAFIAAAEGLETTRAELDGVSCHLDALAADLPALSSACDTFTQSAAQFAAKRSENKQLLSEQRPLLTNRQHCQMLHNWKLYQISKCNQSRF